MASKSEQLFQDYAQYHQHKGNKLTHYIGIPLIILSTIMLLVPLSPLPEILIGLISIYYFRINIQLAIPCLTFFLICLVSSYYLYNLPAAITMFTGGWILQFIGHFGFEKKSPAFFKNLQHLLIGPLWILNDLISQKGSK